MTAPRGPGLDDIEWSQQQLSCYYHCVAEQAARRGLTHAIVRSPDPLPPQHLDVCRSCSLPAEYCSCELYDQPFSPEELGLDPEDC